MAKIHKNLIPTTYFFAKHFRCPLPVEGLRERTYTTRWGQALPAVAFLALAAAPHLVEFLDTHKFPKITQKV